jgi:hypothetical protein
MREQAKLDAFLQTGNGGIKSVKKDGRKQAILFIFVNFLNDFAAKKGESCGWL